MGGKNFFVFRAGEANWQQQIGWGRFSIGLQLSHVFIESARIRLPLLFSCLCCFGFFAVLACPSSGGRLSVTFAVLNCSQKLPVLIPMEYKFFLLVTMKLYGLLGLSLSNKRSKTQRKDLAAVAHHQQPSIIAAM